MGKDLTRRTDIAKSKQAKTERPRGKQTEIERAQEALAERMLFGASARPQQGGPPCIALVIDCTTSMGEFIEERRITLEAARGIAYPLFVEPGMRVRLGFFRGDGSAKHPRQLKFSNELYETPEKLARDIAAIEHWPGWTQHCAWLRHVIAEAEKQAFQSVILISDAFERRTSRRPNGDDLVAAQVHATRLRALGVKLIVGYKG